jgi:molybdopterin synthase sulfur carrier subunit
MKVLYFAWIRERLNRGEDAFDPPATVKTVGDLITWIGENDEAAALVFADRKLISAAVDEELSDHNTPISGAKTIALFPPMTGG